MALKKEICCNNKGGLTSLLGSNNMGIHQEYTGMVIHVDDSLRQRVMAARHRLDEKLLGLSSSIRRPRHGFNIISQLFFI